MKRAVYPLYAPADESKVKPLLEVLKEKGVAVRSAAAKPGRSDALLLFLSENVSAEGPEADAFFRLNAGRKLVIPVNLDGSAPAEALQSALMARHTLDGTKYSAEELADRIARAAKGEGKNRLPLILSAAAAVTLLAVGALILFTSRREEPPEPTPAPVTEATASPAPLPTPRMPLMDVDPASVVEVTYVGGEFYYYTPKQGVSPAKKADQHSWVDVAYGGWVNDGIHFYSKADGHEYPHEAPVDLEWLTLLPNLQYLNLCDVSGELPDLSDLSHLDSVCLGYCRITSLEGLRGSTIRYIEYHGADVEDFSPLTDCDSLTSAHIDLVGSPQVDLTGFHPANLTSLGFGSGYNVKGVNFSGLKECPKLEELYISGFPQIRDLTFLENADALKILNLEDMDTLRDLSGLDHLASLQDLRLVDCPYLRDISALAGCTDLTTIRLEGQPMNMLRDLSVLGTLPKLQNMTLWAPNLQNLDFLRELPTKIRIGFSCGLGSIDCSGLASITTFEDLTLACYGRSFSDVATYLKNATVRNMNIYDAADLVLSDLPRVTGSLSLSGCGIQDLVGIGKQRFSSLSLGNCQQLVSLEGFNELVRMGTEDSDLTVWGCPRLQDWSALRGKKFNSLCLTDVSSLPDLSKLTLRYLQLERIGADALPDLSPLEALGSKQWTSICLLDMDQITSLQPLFSLQGEFLQVPPQLEDQARELVESGHYNWYEILYPSGGWSSVDEEVTLLNWDDLTDLPGSVLKRVRSLTVVGDVLVDPEVTDVDMDWSADPPAAVLTDRTTGEEIARVSAPGTRITDFSGLSVLTGLEDLDLRYQPLTSLDGIQALENLRWLNVQFCPQLTDVSAVFTMQGLKGINFERCPVGSLQGIGNLYDLERLEVCNTDVTSLEGVEELKHLTCVRLSGTEVKDFSPLAATDFTYAREQGGVSLALNVMNGSDLPDDAFAFLVNVPAISRLEVFDVPARLWLGYLPGRPVRDLAANGSGLTQEQFDAFAAAQPELESLSIPYNEGITDVSALLQLEHFRSLWLSRDMTDAIASLGEGHGIDLHIDD